MLYFLSRDGCCKDRGMYGLLGKQLGESTQCFLTEKGVFLQGCQSVGKFEKNKYG